MKLPLQLKAMILGTVSGLAAIGISFATGEMFQRSLFMQNCAHCHGTDARGDEGPDLHGVTKSDARIASLIKDGKKGEMPKFGTKLTDAEVQALVAFVRSLKE
jgi:mono/diheme cytochrome c family protein